MTDRSKCPYCGSGGVQFSEGTWDYSCETYWRPDADKPRRESNGRCSEQVKGYERAIADVAAWLNQLKDDWFSNINDNGQCEHGAWSWEGCETCGNYGILAAIERGEAKGASQ
jgi:hypothetical protein